VGRFPLESAINTMADHDDPIIISDDEEEQQRRPKRSSPTYSKWYGQRKRGGVARPPRVSKRERSMLAYILAVAQMLHPNHPMNAINNAHYLAGRYDQIRVLNLVSVATKLSRPVRVHLSSAHLPVQMS